MDSFHRDEIKQLAREEARYRAGSSSRDTGPPPGYFFLALIIAIAVFWNGINWLIKLADNIAVVVLHPLGWILVGALIPVGGVGVFYFKKKTIRWYATSEIGLSMAAGIHATQKFHIDESVLPWAVAVMGATYLSSRGFANLLTRERS
jgi:hypothetical protein